MIDPHVSLSNESAAVNEHKLHALSSLFSAAHQLKKVVFPLLAFIFWQTNLSKTIIFSALGALVAVIAGILQARSFRYSVANGELLVRAGVWNRTVKHIPFSRIQSINQRRGFFHRLFGVTELRLDSASGGKHEALMTVLSIEAAASLEELLRGAIATVNVTKSNGEQSIRTDEVPNRKILLRLELGELIRHGLISNQSLVVLAAGFGFLSKNREHLLKFSFLNEFIAPLRDLSIQDYALNHLFLISFLLLVSLLAVVLCLRIFSIGYAIFKYYGFKLESQDEGLHAEYGLINKIRCGVRVPRLQRLVLVQNWLHRWFGRCRLAVDVIGGEKKDKSGAEARLRELAPIATPEQAGTLLRACIPEFDLSQLSWQPLHPRAAMRRMRKSMTWLLPMLLLAIGLDIQSNWFLPKPILFALISFVCVALWMHAKAWAHFSAYAEHANCLVYRTGVLTQRWIIVMPARLQSVSLLSTALDRRTGMQRLRADTQGGSCKAYALDIPYLPIAEAQRLRELIWGRISQMKQR